jgi:hypothetical protein
MKSIRSPLLLDFLQPQTTDDDDDQVSSFDVDSLPDLELTDAPVSFESDHIDPGFGSWDGVQFKILYWQCSCS